jgi:glycerate dehydrogenase
MESIVFLDRNTLRADVRRPSFEHAWREYEKTSPAEVVERLRDATIAITNKVPLGRDAINQLPRLKMIAVAATGVDMIDLAAAGERGVVVSNVRGYARTVVPEHVFALILALRRQLIAFHEDVRRGRWAEAEAFCLLDHPVRDLAGSTLGLVGHGSIGRGVERIARAFGMRVLVAERKGADAVREGRAAFDEVVRESDVLSLHVPLNEETRHLIGAQELRMMKREALLINCARGGVVDERALAEALRGRVIAGAGVDVLTREPPRDGNPLLAPDLPNLVLTPHVAWASLEAMQALADQLVENIEAFARGAPKNLVTSDE